MAVEPIAQGTPQWPALPKVRGWIEGGWHCAGSKVGRHAPRYSERRVLNLALRSTSGRATHSWFLVFYDPDPILQSCKSPLDFACVPPRSYVEKVVPFSWETTVRLSEQLGKENRSVAEPTIK